MCDSLLALLDDASFRPFDLLGLEEGTQRDYKLLLAALTGRGVLPPALGYLNYGCL